MKKVLIYGFFSQGNFGDDALLSSIVEGIRALCGQVSFRVAVRHPSQKMDELFKVTTIQNLEYNKRSESIGRWLQGFNQDDGEQYTRFLKEVTSADLVIIGPGQYIVETGADGLFRGNIAQLDAITTMCNMVGTQVFGVALTAENLKHSFSKLRVQDILGRLSAVTFRDSATPNYLRSLEIELPDHGVFADLSLALPPAALDNHFPSLLLRCGLGELRKPVLGVAVHDAYWDAKLRLRIERQTTASIKYWIEHTNGDVLLIPQAVSQVDAHANDIVYASVIKSRLASTVSDRTHSIYEQLNYKETELLYSLCQATLCSRMHGALFSLRQNVPTVLYEFERKRRGVFRTAGFENYLCSLELPTQSIGHKLVTYANCPDISNQIAKKIEKASESSRHHLYVAENLLARPLTEKQRRCRVLTDSD